jgi:hypothetical protein
MNTRGDNIKRDSIFNGKEPLKLIVKDILKFIILFNIIKRAIYFNITR